MAGIAQSDPAPTAVENRTRHKKPQPFRDRLGLDQLQDNLAAVELTLTEDQLRQLDDVSALAPEYPGWVLPFQGADRLELVHRWEHFREAREQH